MKNLKPGMVLLSAIAALSFLTFALPALGTETFPFFRDVREEGMGGAAVAVVDDETALYLNPAGLGKVRGSYLMLLNPQIEANYNTTSALGASLGSALGINDPQTLLSLGKQNPGKPLHADVQVLPTFVTTNFGLGVYGKYSVDAEYNPSSNLLGLNYTNDYGADIGYCFRLFSGRLKIGVSGKVDNRVYINNQSIPGSSTNLTIASLASEGDGVGWDGGAILTLPWTFLPTIAVTAHDIGNTYFNLGNGYFYKPGIQPPPQMQMVNVAAALFPIHSNHTRSTFTLEYDDVQNPQAEAVRNIHAGVEINFDDVLFLRGGYNEGYYTAGLELDFFHNQIQLATYGEEIGTATSLQEDRRFVFEYGLRF